MFLCRVKNVILTATALLLALFFGVLARFTAVSRFSELDGRRSFYLDSTSSQALVKSELSPLDIFRIKGESVSFEFANREETLSSIVDLYGAELLFAERAGGSVSYYCVTDKWTEGVLINGVFVNLHIAFNGELCAVGAPFIFGGF